MTKPASDYPEVRALEDLAWSVKDTVADFYSRSLSAADKSVLASVSRDLERLQARLVALRDKRKRGNGAAEPEPTAPTDPRQTHIPGTEPTP